VRAGLHGWRFGESVEVAVGADEADRGAAAQREGTEEVGHERSASADRRGARSDDQRLSSSASPLLGVSALFRLQIP
jgi:hypothetical protein